MSNGTGCTLWIRNSEVIEKIEVKWTNGEVTEYKDFKINETLVINQLD